MNLRRVFPIFFGLFVITSLLVLIATKPRFGKREPQVQRASEASHLPALERFLIQESEKFGRADKNPESKHRRLKAVASALGRYDIDTLKKYALDAQRPQAERALSVYLLSLAKKDHVGPALLGIALSHFESQEADPDQQAHELLIRTQALEGIAQLRPSVSQRFLRDFIKRQNDPFLADQALRLINQTKWTQRASQSSPRSSQKKQ